jgi:hypothetical protein
MRFAWARWCMLLGLSLLAACARDKPTAPEQRYSLSGHLRLTGYFVNPDGSYGGTRVMGDADGVTVELLHGTEVVGRTTTEDGIYRFSGLRPGDYVARSSVMGIIGDQTVPLVIATSDVSSADTLRLASRGDLFPVPNPFVDLTQVYFLVPDTTWVDVDILDVSGNPITSLLSLEVLPAHHAVFWNGRDRLGQPVEGSLFWVTYRADFDVRAHLLFRQEASP